MPLSWVKVKFADFRSQVLGELATELEAEVSEDLVEALAAATSLVAFSDGVLKPEEREELLSVFEEEDRLTELDLDDLFDAFDDYAERFAEADGQIPATFEVLYLCGWAPHPSQPAPLKRGSATARLADALRTKS